MQASVIHETLIKPDALDIIYERRAVRKYQPRIVDRKIIEKVIDAGRMAPSALNKQPWKFYVLTQKEVIRAFSKAILKIVPKEIIKAGPKEIFKQIVHFLHFPQGLSFVKSDDPVFHNAPVVIFITASRDNEWASLDIGMCAQNMMLAAKYYGLDTCPIGFAKYVEGTSIYGKLNIPESEIIHLAVILGYGDEIPELHKRKKNNVHFIDP
jgi:nitroreductase